MYTEKTPTAVKMTQAKFVTAIKKEINTRIASDWHKGSRPDLIAARDDKEQFIVNSLARQLHELNQAMLKDRAVFAVCDKAPVNLDRGRHYYSVYYVNTKGQKSRIWARELHSLIGQDSQSRERSLSKYIFSSGALGMSRLLDATDGLFTFLKHCGGCYAQIDLI